MLLEQSSKPVASNTTYTLLTDSLTHPDLPKPQNHLYMLWDVPQVPLQTEHIWKFIYYLLPKSPVSSCSFYIS